MTRQHLFRLLFVGMLAALAGLPVMIAGCSEAISAWEAPVQLRNHPAVPKLVQDLNRFGLDVYRHLGPQESGNFIFSPASIGTALAMTYAGADGDTADEMRSVMHWELPDDQVHSGYQGLLSTLDELDGERLELRIGNRLWGQQNYEFRKDFLTITRDRYQAELGQLDFAGNLEQARETINRWVSEETKDKIQDLLPEGSLNPLTRLVLTNAVYFKGDWEREFSERMTKDQAFFVTPDKAVQVPLMSGRGTYRYGENERLQWVGLDYVGEASMWVLLPKAKDGLAELESGLSGERLADWIGESREQEIQLSLPKFKLSSRLDLNQLLSDMGMASAFGPDADFSKMNGRRDLHIGAVLHQAYIDVNEQGTEAAAATGVALKVRSLPKPVPEFRADHPFTFLIRDDSTGAILFLGRVANPSEG